MHIAINPSNIGNENKKGGRCNKSIAKSATNKLVKKGWSTKALRIFFKIAIQSFMSAVKVLLEVYGKKTA